jgi:hypothetical protein
MNEWARLSLLRQALSNVADMAARHMLEQHGAQNNDAVSTTTKPSGGGKLSAETLRDAPRAALEFALSLLHAIAQWRAPLDDSEHVLHAEWHASAAPMLYGYAARQSARQIDATLKRWHLTRQNAETQVLYDVEHLVAWLGLFVGAMNDQWYADNV